MRDHKHLQLKFDGDSATLCVHGALDHDSAASMRELCSALPLAVRTLRVDLRALGAMNSETTGLVRSLLAYWRTTRGGEFRLITSHLLATCSPVSTAAVAKLAPTAATSQCEAMTAAFL